MGKGPMIIEERNLSVAWGKAFLKVLEANEVAPLVVAIKDLDGGEPRELPAVRDALDQMLDAQGKGSCHTVANTIFPSGMWNPEAGREELFDRYLGMCQHLRKHKGNKYGLYFQRLIAFGCDNNGEGGFNQLDHILTTWNGGNHRRTALQASLFDPLKDHTNQRQRGFPCLQQVSFAPTGTDGLSITGFYATQYVIERAYGNYLGLCRLGQFMAHEMGLRLDLVTCIATPAKRDCPKFHLQGLTRSVRDALAQLPAEVHRG